MDFQSLVENVPLGIFRIAGEPPGKFLLANSDFLKLLGYGSGKKLSGFDMKDIFLRFNINHLKNEEHKFK